MVIRKEMNFKRLDLCELHGVGIPLHNRLAFIAEVAEQSGSGGAEAEDGVLDDGLAAANGGEEVLEVVVAVAVASGRCVGFKAGSGGSGWVRGRILLAVLREDALLHGFGI